MAKDAIVRLKVDSKEYDSKIERARAGMLHLEETLRKSGKTFKDADESQVAFMRDIGKMPTQTRTARGALSELTKGYTDFAMQYKRMSDLEKQSPTGQALLGSLSQLKTRIDETKKALKEVEGELGGTAVSGNSLKDTISALGGQFGISSDAIGVLTTGTIAYTAAIAAAAAAVAAAAKAWADYNSELSSQGQVTTVTTGLQGTDAEEMTLAARALASTYNVDFREAINAANTLMTQFGTTGDEAIQLLRQGMQGMIAGDGPKLLSMIQQFAPAFQSAGVSASQLVAIIQNTEGGIFTDSNMQAIVMGMRQVRNQTKAVSEALEGIGIDSDRMAERLKDGQMNVFDALQQVSVAIEANKDKTEAVGAVMQSVFGRQGAMAGTNLGKAIATLNTNLEETTKQTGKVGEAFDRLAESNLRLEKIIAEAAGVKDWQEMEAVVKGRVINAVAALLESVVDLRKVLSDVGGMDVWTNLRNALLNCIGPLGTLVSYAEKLFGILSDTPDVQPVPAAPSTTGAMAAAQVGIDAVPKVTTSTRSSDKKKQDKQDIYAPDSIRAQQKLVQQLTDEWERAGASVRDSILPRLNEAKQRLAEMQRQNVVPGSMTDLQQRLSDLQKQQSAAANPQEWQQYQRQIDAVTNSINILKGVLPKDSKAQFTVDVNADQLAQLQSIMAQNGKTIRVNVEAGNVNLPEVPTDDETIRVNVEAGTVNLPEVPTDDETVRVNVEATTEESMRQILALIGSNPTMEVNVVPVGDLAPIDEMKQKIQDSLLQTDFSALSSLLTASIQNGLDNFEGDFTSIQEALAAGINVPDEVWIDLQDRINAALEEMKLDPIKLDVNTGKVKNAVADAVKMSQAWNAAGSAIQAVGNAMSMIEDPMAKVMGTIAQAIAAVALGAANALASSKDHPETQGWAWIAFAASVAATMVGTIAAIHSATGYANGGVVDGRGGGFVGGTAYSGDNIGNVRLDAGELVLNRSQQSALADELERSDSDNGGEMQPYVSGEQIYLGLNNYLRRSGRGELITSR